MSFDYAINRPVDLFANGKLLYHGRVVDTGRMRGFYIDSRTGQE